MFQCHKSFQISLKFFNHTTDKCFCWGFFFVTLNISYQQEAQSQGYLPQESVFSLPKRPCDDTFSAGILLTAPIPRFTIVTASEVDMSLFSKGSCMGLIQQKSTAYIPAITQAKPMKDLLSWLTRMRPDVRMNLRDISIVANTRNEVCNFRREIALR